MSDRIDTIRFEPVALEDVVRRAAFETRVDRKYVVSHADAELLANLVPADTRVLEIEGRRSFEYRSVYFDTPARDSYLRTAYGRRRRFKVRTREYPGTGALFLEVKTRPGRFTVKERISCLSRGLLTAEDVAYIGERLEAAGVAGIAAGRLEPVLRTGYRRATLVPAGGSCRVTFDSDVSFTTEVGERRGYGHVLPGLTVVETKTSGPPSSVDRLLWSLGIRPVAFSKYATGLATLHPELPHARWARLLRSRLAVAADPLAPVRSDDAWRKP